MTNQQETEKMSEKQERAIRVLCKKSGLPKPRRLQEFTKEEASHVISQLMDVVDSWREREL